MNRNHSRREFLRRAVLAGTAVPLASYAGGALRDDAAPKPKSPSERLTLAVIGAAGRGGENLDAVASETIAVLCDVDRQRLAESAKKHPHAETTTDFRRALEHKGLDAAVISTPDHTHAVIAAAALRAGLDVYCEKPLAHSVHEVRVLRRLASEHKRVTQMGTQIHAGDNYRRAVEIVRGGVLGKVRRVHVWMGGRPHAGLKRAAAGDPPAHVDYDLWLGPAPYRPFHTSHFHFVWRYWWDFGGGMLADFGCHYMDLPHWALDLRAPATVEAKGEKDYEGDNEVPGKMRVDYHYPARGAEPPVHLTWYHGGWKPDGAEVYGLGSAVLFEGEHGRLLADYGTHKLFMDEAHKDAKVPPPSIPPSKGHHREWIEAVKTRGETTCNFDYSGALTEAVLLGNVSYRAGQKKLEFDAEALRVTNAPEAAQYIRREYRKGWEL
jgi:predicted dehydrogenase